MKFTLNWLRHYIDFDATPAELADRLTMLGLEVDAVEDLYPGLDNVYVARVEDVLPHPNADKLVLCDVAVGADRHRVVCGAPNVKAGMLTAIALPGASLPNGMKVKPAKIRGEASHGMLCSEKELGISEEKSGIMVLPDSIECGMSLVEALSLKDTFVEVDLTPNRPDCASVIGIAREVAGFTGGTLSVPVAGELPALTGRGVPFSVSVDAPHECPRYAARLLKNVKVGPSPWWLKQRLLAIGLRPINNVVDITNFVMMEYGQPLHAFDFQMIAGKKIIVRKAAAGEKMVTIDGEERVLEPDMLLICDAEKPLAVAGVMGGQNSEVTDGTTEILLESAYFDPVSIRRTAGRLNMSTDSSYRFERGVDPAGIPRALERAVRLIEELAGAEAVAGGVDACHGLPEPVVLTLRVRRAADLLGMEFTAEAIITAFASIEIGAEKIDDETIRVAVPSFRVDLEREIDLIEELARITGYNAIPVTLPLVPMKFPEQDAERDRRRQVAAAMLALGFYEAINYSFAAEQHFDMLGLRGDDPARTAVRLLNPLAEDQSVMRTTLLPALLENLRRNLNHQTSDVRLFEIGKVFRPRPGQELPDEDLRLTAVCSGRRHPGAPMLHEGATPVDIHDLKGLAEQLLILLRLPQVRFDFSVEPVVYGERQQYFALMADDLQAGQLGKIGADVLKAFGIKQDVFFLDLDLTVLFRLESAPKAFAPLPRFPAVKWDIAVLVPEEVPAGDLLAAISQAGESLIEHAEIFDIFRGRNIEPGMKSVALSVTYRSAEGTLDDATVGRVHQKIIDLLLSRFNGQLREA